jgi:lipid-A-disaccharide synthase
MYAILPFEQDFYKKMGVEVEYFGHPLVDVVHNFKHSSFEQFCKDNDLSGKPIIAVMAGSRKQEITHMLPIMIKASESFPEYDFIITGAPAITKEFYSEIIKDKPIHLLFGKTYEILSHAKAGMITSGTATLEAALFGLPQVVCYKGGKLSVAIARMVANVKYISLVNLILDEPAVKELIQYDLNEINLVDELKNILPGGKKHLIIKDFYVNLYNRLDQPGVYYRIAQNMIKRIMNE